MNRCRLQEPDFFARLLDHMLTAEEKRYMETHLAAECESCMAVLEHLDVGLLLKKIGGARAVLSRREADNLFGSIVARLPKPAKRSHGDMLRAWLFPRPAWALAACAIALLIGVPLALRPSTPWTGDKGSARPSVALLGYAVSSNGARAFVAGSALPAHSNLAFRYRLSQPAFLYLFSDREADPLWEPSSNAPSPAGEAEISAGEQALGLPKDRISHGATLKLLASPHRLSSQEAEAIVRGKRRCEECAMDPLVIAGMP